MFCVRRDCMVFGIYLLCMQLVSITANVVSKSRSWRGVLDTTLNEKTVNDLKQVGAFRRLLRYHQQIKLTARKLLKYC